MSDHPRVLVVEDESELRDVLVKLLQREGHTVLSAGTGQEALTILETQPVDVILSDIAMPEVDGLELLKRLRPLCPSAQVLLMSAHATFDVAFEGLKFGASGFIEKPFRSAQVLKAVRDALTRVRGTASTAPSPS